MPQNVHLSEVERPWMSLTDDEEVLAWAHPSIFKYLSQIIYGLVVFFAGIGIIAFVDIHPYVNYLGGFAILSGIFWIGYEIADYMTTWYIVTNDHVIKKTAILGTDPDKLPVYRIEKTSPHKPFDPFKGVWDRLLGYGEITIYTGATSDAEMFMGYVPDPDLFATVLDMSSNAARDDEEITLAQVKERLNKKQN